MAKTLNCHGLIRRILIRRQNSTLLPKQSLFIQKGYLEFPGYPFCMNEDRSFC